MAFKMKGFPYNGSSPMKHPHEFRKISEFPHSHAKTVRFRKPDKPGTVVSRSARKIGDWFRQAKRDCKPGKIPFLIFSKNYFPDFFLFEREPIESILSLKKQSMGIFKQVLYTVPSVFIIPKTGMAIGMLDSFLDNVSKADIIKAGEEGCLSMITDVKSVVKSSNGFSKSLTVPVRLKRRAVKKKKPLK